MPGVYTTLEELHAELKRCENCCNGDYLSIHCPLCPVWKYKPRQTSKVKKNLLVHWQTGVKGQDGKYIMYIFIESQQNKF